MCLKSTTARHFPRLTCTNMVVLFVYPFLYGLQLSFHPMEGNWLANYTQFFTTGNLRDTVWTTLKLAIPATVINVGAALPIAYQMRRSSRFQRLITTLLVIPLTLGTVLIAEGMSATART